MTACKTSSQLFAAARAAARHTPNAAPHGRDRIYKGYRLFSHGYYPPDRCVWWQAENIETGEADFHAHTMRDLKAQIDSANAGVDRPTMAGKEDGH